jgi:putative transposase
MILTEKHIINKSNPLYKEIDNICFLSKNLYNAANYIIRQEFLKTRKLKEEGVLDNAIYLGFTYMNRLFTDVKNIDFYALPIKVSNHTLMALDWNWRSFFASIKDWKGNPENHKNKPNIPKYLPKTKGRFVAEYELGAISVKELRSGFIKLSGTNVKIPFINHNKEGVKLKLCRIIPSANNKYIINIIYEKQETNLNLNKNNIIGIDLGVNNLATLTSNKVGYIPQIINGRPLKSYNQYYNKQRSILQEQLAQNKQGKTSNKIKQLTHKRNCKVDNYIHKASKHIIDDCIRNDIGTIVIGKNDGWKNNINMSKVNNQNFVDIPFNDLIHQLQYKGKMIGIDVILTEESYTSRASFLDLDEMPVYQKPNSINEITELIDIDNESTIIDVIDTKGNKKKYIFSGYREHRGSYKLKGRKKRINADVNGSYNSIRKVFPNAFANGTEGIAVYPVMRKLHK